MPGFFVVSRRTPETGRRAARSLLSRCRFKESYLAAQLVAGAGLEDDQEVLVVTLVNSAVDNFAGRVAAFVQERGLLPHVGYRVRTLHGLAHDIVREHPGLVGLADDFQIVDEREAGSVLQDAVDAWLTSHPYAVDDFLALDMEERKQDWVRRDADRSCAGAPTRARPQPRPGRPRQPGGRAHQEGRARAGRDAAQRKSSRPRVLGAKWARQVANGAK